MSLRELIFVVMFEVMKELNLKVFIFFMMIWFVWNVILVKVLDKFCRCDKDNLEKIFKDCKIISSGCCMYCIKRVFWKVLCFRIYRLLFVVVCIVVWFGLLYLKNDKF